MPADIKLLGSSQRELFPKHLFLVEISPDISAGFQKCSELSVEAAAIEYWEGGSIIPYKIPGRLTFTDITLERGASTSPKFFQWMQSVGDAAQGIFPTRGAGWLTPDYMEQIDVIQLDRDGITTLRVWTLYNAWPSKFVAGDWDNTVDEAVIESLTLKYDYFEIS
jgi:phage tail-like protein